MLGRLIDRVKKGRDIVPLHQGLINLMVKWATPISIERSFNSKEERKEAKKETVTEATVNPTLLLLPGPVEVMQESKKQEWIVVGDDVEILDQPPPK